MCVHAMTLEAHDPWPLIHPVAIAADDPEHPALADKSTTAAAYTTIGREVEFWFTVSKGMWLLHASNLETLDPYGGDPIRSLVEVICAHRGLVLLRLHTPHRNFPTDYFVYGYNTCGRKGPWVDKLPEIEPLIRSTSSIGLLRRTNHYVVANLLQELNPKTGQLEMFLDCYSSKNNKWSRRQGTLISPDGKEECLWGWQTDRVIPFNKTLLWVDLSRGILLCRSLLDDSSSHAKFHVVPHPSGLLLPDDGLRWEHPQPFWSVGCSKGKVKLVSLRSLQGADAGAEVLTWVLDLDQLEWREEPSTSLNYTRLRADMKSKLQRQNSLPPFDQDNSPCYPVMSTDQRDILYLTVAAQNMAWLLRIDMHTLDDKHICTLEDIANYPRFCEHLNPPYPSDLPKYLNNRSEGDRQLRRPPRRSKRKLSKQPEGEVRYSLQDSRVLLKFLRERPRVVILLIVFILQLPTVT
ncbi:unnamed protein product [Urochloa decumbens]|uniref:DUF1618 domain-containing protein n=1 Tax=Urochloa decumbens TaxID=240449 RepID=A0ABC8VIJ4_9POAL